MVNVNGFFSKLNNAGAAIMLLALTGLLYTACTPAPCEKEKVIAAAQQLLDVLETHDIQKAKDNLVPGATLASVCEGDCKKPFEYQAFDDFFDSLVKFKDRRKELISGVKVIIQKRIALLWADYKLFLDNGHLDHCGVNAFSFIKEKDTWKCVNVVYTHETVGCENMNSVAVPGDETAKKKIIAVVQRFLDMLETRDVSKADEILLPQGLSVSSRGQGSEAVMRIRSFKETIDSLPGGTSRYKEVMTDAGTLVHKGIGIVRTGYKFYIDGKFSHDGVDIFSLVRTPKGWKIAGLVYTVNKKREKKREKNGQARKF